MYISKLHLEGFKSFLNKTDLVFAEGVTAVEELMKLTKDTSMPTTPTQVSVTPDLQDLKSMMADPKYWKDGEKDAAYIKRVTDLYEKAFEKNKA